MHKMIGGFEKGPAQGGDENQLDTIRRVLCLERKQRFRSGTRGRSQPGNRLFLGIGGGRQLLWFGHFVLLRSVQQMHYLATFMLELGLPLKKPVQISDCAVQSVHT
jgi:hypothetical protein